MAPKAVLSGAKPANPQSVIIPDNEYSTGNTSLDTIQSGVEQFQTHGFVVLENAIATSVIDKLRTKMLEDAATCLTFPDLVFNHGNEKNNFSVTPPLSNEFFIEDIWANKHAADIMQQIIGPRPLLCWASSNVLIKSGEGARQAVHSDAYTDIPNFPFCVEMNIYLQDTNPENGSTEIWPGTHVFTEDDHLPHGRGWIKKKAFTDRARKSPPIQPTISAGSILLRDLRLWHAGMPSTSITPRIIVALLYFPQWFRPHMRLTLPISVRPKAEAWKKVDLISNTDFVEGHINHLRTHFPMNFTQDSTKGLMEYRIAVDKMQGREPGAHIPVTKNNYWTLSKPRTRAAKKRALEDQENHDRLRKKTQKQETAQMPPVKHDLQVEVGFERASHHDSDLRTNVKIENGGGRYDTFQLPSSDKILAPSLKHEENTENLRIKRGSEQDKNLLDSLSDYEDSPTEHAPWILGPPEDISFKPGYTPNDGASSQISPAFSPKSQLGFTHKMKTAQEEWLDKHAHFKQSTEKEFWERRSQEPLVIPEAKMLPDPRYLGAAAASSMRLLQPPPLQLEETAWDADLGRYRSSSSPPYISSPLTLPPLQFPLDVSALQQGAPQIGGVVEERQEEQQQVDELHGQDEQGEQDALSAAEVIDEISDV